VLTADELEARRVEIAAGGDLSQLRSRLAERAQPILDRMPPVPAAKAVLTADGGVCPEDGTRLEFDPWSPTEHRCPRCGRSFRGERHDAAWAHYQHLWLAERAAHLAMLGVLDGRPDAVGRANQLLSSYRNYSEFPNRDNVLGPSRLFFSTYLESIWLGNYLAAAFLLREAGQLSDETAEIVAAVADESAGLIGEFDEGLSNRQTWHNAALASVAVWFEDEELATRVVEGPSGILAHLLQGFGPDGMWYEGDNYHLFALRGQLLAMRWAQQAGVSMLADPRLAARVAAALRAPAITALPDFTFPARKDSRFGVSLAQPMYLELWEVGLARLNQTAEPSLELWEWLGRLYESAAPPAQTFDSYLNEAGEPPPDRHRTRADLSWWSLLEMLPAVPDDPPAWSATSTFLEGQGLAVLRSGNRYVSLECGPYGGGHGHPDRLNLVLHDNGEYWLPDFGTGSYVARDLFWYRSTLAHNAPRLDGESQSKGDAVCENFEENGPWAWARAQFGDLSRTVVAGPAYVLDVVELSGGDDHLLELPLHLSGTVELVSPGRWQPDELSDEFVQQVERFVPTTEAPVILRACGSTGASLGVHLEFPGDLLRVLGPGAPGTSGPVPFYLVRSRGRHLRLVTVLESPKPQEAVRSVSVEEVAIEVETSAGADRHLATAEGWEVRTSNGGVRLRGERPPARAFQPLIRLDRPMRVKGIALPVAHSPELDGTLKGFDIGEPLELDHDDQYRQSEDPYPGPEEFSARAYVNWSDEGIYLAVQVTKADIMARDPAAAPLRLDNEPDEIHSDGIQVYLRQPEQEAILGWLIVPSSSNGELIIRSVSDAAGEPGTVRGSWQPTEDGYTITVAIVPAGWAPTTTPGEEIGFDLLVNRMLPDRTRRAGQLVWSGGGGWVWLRGDRQDPERFGTLELR
jgi:hypothetical protein